MNSSDLQADLELVVTKLYKHARSPDRTIVLIDNHWHGTQWLLTGDGMLATIEKMREHGYSAQLSWPPGHKPWARFIDGWNEADSLPEAIIRAAAAVLRAQARER